MNEDFSYYLDAAKYLHRLPVRHSSPKAAKDRSQKAAKDRSQKAATDSPKPEGQDKLPENKNDGQPK